MFRKVFALFSPVLQLGAWSPISIDFFKYSKAVLFSLSSRIKGLTFVIASNVVQTKAKHAEVS